MSTFTFKGINQDGMKVIGSNSFANETEAKKYLDEKNLLNYQVYTSNTKYFTQNYKAVTAKELSVFSRQMTVLFISNITLMEGVLLLAEQSDNKQLKIALSEMYKHMENGYTFSEALAMYPHIFGSYLIDMVKIGEASGTLDNIFSRMADYYAKESMIRKKLKSAITYPAILSLLMGSIVLLLILKILPMFNNILESMGGSIPAVTSIILGFSKFLGMYLPIIIIVILIIYFTIRLYTKTEKGRLWYDKMRVSLPLFRYVNSRVVTSRFSRSMSILLKSGVQLLNAFEQTAPLIDNKYLELKFKNAVEKVKNGEDLSPVLKEINIFPPLFLKMIVIGQSTGHMDEMLDRSANIFDEEIYDSIERITLFIEPLLIIILSVIVGIILLSVMLPMIGIMNAIG